MHKEPWLVQRLERHSGKTTNSGGVDKYFSMEYMGSSEFEIGTLPKSLKEFRKWLKSDKYIFIRKIKTTFRGNDYCCWYYGPEMNYAMACSFFEQQIQEPYGGNLKEPTRIHNVYVDDLSGFIGRTSWYKSIIGWWCIDPDIAFCLFKVKADAKLWKRGIEQYKG